MGKAAAGGAATNGWLRLLGAAVGTRRTPWRDQMAARHMATPSDVLQSTVQCEHIAHSVGVMLCHSLASWARNSHMADLYKTCN